MISRLTRFCGAIGLLVLARGAGLAGDGACTTARDPNGYFRVGNGYVGVVDRGEEWTYVLKPLTSNWRIRPPDRHSSGHIFCENCASASTGFGGEFNWHVQPRPASTAAERAERRTEYFGHWAFRWNQLEVQGTREQVSLGPLSGYAVLYRLSLPHISQPNEPPAVMVGSVIVVYLKDGCIEFETYISAKPGADGNDWLPLDSLLSGMMIKKSPSAEAEIPARH